MIPPKNAPSDSNDEPSADGAANDANFIPSAGQLGEPPPALSELTAVTAACRRVLDAPPDLAIAELALAGLAVAIDSLADLVPGAVLIAQRVRDAQATIKQDIAKGATVLAFNRRTGHYLLYLSAVTMGRAMASHSPLDATVLRLAGARFLLRLFRDAQPSRGSLCRTTAAIEAPSSPLAAEWSQDARARAAIQAMKALERAIENDRSTAVAYGLAPPVVRPLRSTDPIDAFNREFRRRADNLRDFATLDAVGAAGGFGTLSPQALHDAGEMLLSMAQEGDAAAALVCLEIVTHLTANILLKLPLQVGDEPPKDALAWLNLAAGTYHYLLFRLVERAARPDSGTEHLYEDSVQVVTVHLTPPLADTLRNAAQAATHRRNIQDILGDVGHHPRSAVVGESAYRVTARRLQESLPTILIQRGHARWPVALATNSHFLVSRGRPAYGVCRSTHVDGVVLASCDLLGWPAPQVRPTGDLVGGYTTAKPISISKALDHLAARADDTSVESADAVIAYFNRHAEWFAALLALTFALRRWLVYEIIPTQLREGDGASVNDKDVHAMSGMPIPVPELARQAMQGWDRVVEHALVALHRIGDARSLQIAERIEARQVDPKAPAFTINAALEVEPVGYLTWFGALPPNLRLRPSFARQFWPLHLLDHGIEQLLADILMRHQISGLYIGAWHQTAVLAEDLERLRGVIESVLGDLELHVPVAMGGA